jgi:hypothetical protein
MASAASGQGGLLVRVDPEQGEKLLRNTAAEMAVMQGRALSGWLRVNGDAVATKRELNRWVKTGTPYARSLPKKSGAAKSAAKKAA